MVPLEVGSDPRLTARDVRVYLALSASRRGADVTVGVRRIAQYSRVGFRKIGTILGKLEKYGHIAIEPAEKNGARARYHLTAPLFSKVTVGVEASGEGDFLAKPELLRCPRCHKRCGGLLKVGWCRSCNWEVKVRKITRDEMSKSA